MGSLDKRVAIVTGASSGIGKAVAHRYAQEGAAVVLCARRRQNLDELAGAITSAGGKAVPIVCDVSKEADITNAVKKTIETFGTVHILANIAQGNMGEMRYLAEVSVQGVLDSYISGPVQSMLFMQQCLPYMKAQKYGRIINTGSHAALFGEKGFAAYNMAKGAIMALTRVASQEWAPFGIVTNTVLPMVWTEAWDMSEQGKAAAVVKGNAIPVGRFGRPEDTLPVYTLLASAGASYINGQTIGVDGGMDLIA